MTTARGLVLAIGIITALSGVPAHAESANPYLQKGIDLYLDFEYEAALEQLKMAASAEDNARFDKIQIGLWLGYIRMELGDEEGAQADFTTTLKLDPKLELPAKISPKVAVVFERAREQVLKTIPLVPPPPPAATSTPPKAPPDQAAEPSLAASNGPASEAQAPEEAPSPSSAEASTLLAYSEQVPAEAISGRAPSRADTYTTPGRVAAYVLAGVGVALAGSGAFFGVRSSRSATEAEEAHFQSDAAARLDAAQGQALTANILFGAAGAAAVGGIISFLAGGPSSEASSSALGRFDSDPAPVPRSPWRDRDERDPFGADD